MRVLKVDNEKVRLLIERFIEQNCKPDAIVFVRDGLGNWVTSEEVLTDLKFTFQKVMTGETKEGLESKLSVEVTKENLGKQFGYIAELIQEYGELIDYVPVSDVDFEKVVTKANATQR